MLQRLLIVWLVLLSALAYAWPWQIDPFVASRPGLSALITVTMFALGSVLPRNEATQVVRQWPQVLAGTGTQYLVMPALAWTIGSAMGFEGPRLVGLVLVGAVPGAMGSNVLTLAARGNVSYSVSLTTSATLLSPIAVPLALRWTLGTRVALDPGPIAWNLLWTVAGPVVLGHLLCRRFGAFERRMRTLGPMIANLAILWIIAVVVAVNRDRLDQLDARMLAALALINAMGYLAGYGSGRICRLNEPMRRALTLEVGMQNAGLGSVMALKFFAETPTAAIAPAAYTFGCMLTGAMLAQWWSRTADGR